MHVIFFRCVDVLSNHCIERETLETEFGPIIISYYDEDKRRQNDFPVSISTSINMIILTVIKYDDNNIMYRCCSSVDRRFPASTNKKKF